MIERQRPMHEIARRPSWRVAPHGRSWIHYLVGVALHALVFAGFGPPLGTLIVTGGIFWLMLFPFVVGVAYMGVTGAAAAAGASVAVATSFLTTPWKLYAAAAGLGATWAMLLGSLGPDFVGQGPLEILAAAGAFASVLCTRITRGLRLTNDNPFFRVGAA